MTDFIKHSNIIVRYDDISSYERTNSLQITVLFKNVQGAFEKLTCTYETIAEADWAFRKFAMTSRAFLLDSCFDTQIAEEIHELRCASQRLSVNFDSQESSLTERMKMIEKKLNKLIRLGQGKAE